MCGFLLLPMSCLFQDINMVVSLMKLLECHLDEFKPEMPAGATAKVTLKEMSDAQLTSLMQVRGTALNLKL
jgi:hypothetical protein